MKVKTKAQVCGDTNVEKDTLAWWLAPGKVYRYGNTSHYYLGIISKQNKGFVYLKDGKIDFAKDVDWITKKAFKQIEGSFVLDD